MKLAKTLKIIVFFTILSLVYTHMQMRIYDLAYQGQVKEDRVRELTQRNGDITYTILSLKSSNNLGIELLSEDSDMQFGGREDVIKVSASEEYMQTSLLSNEERRQGSSFMRFLSIGKRAEARNRE